MHAKIRHHVYGGGSELPPMSASKCSFRDSVVVITLFKQTGRGVRVTQTSYGGEW
jgi:hypothetical protein